MATYLMDGPHFDALARALFAACGSNGGACTNCLASDQLCAAGACQACDVTCASGNAATCGAALQAKLNAGGPDTVRVYPGLYQGNVSIGRSVTVIGAGQGADEIIATILDGANAGSVVTIADSTATVELESLRNGAGGEGGRLPAGAIPKYHFR